MSSQLPSGPVSDSSLRYLVAEDDAAWANAFSQWARFTVGAEIGWSKTVESTLEQIDGRRRWDGAIFDLALPIEDDSIPALHVDSAVLSGRGLQKEFPGRPVVIWSGLPLQMRPPLPGFLFELEDLTFVDKGSGAVERVGLFLRERRILDPENDPPTQDSFWDFVLARPNWGGIGVDLRVVYERVMAWLRSRRRN